MFSGVPIVTGNTTDQKNELKQNGFQIEPKTNRFSEHFCLTDGSNLRYVSFTKNLASRLKKALSYGKYFWEKNIRFVSLTSHLSNGKLGKRIGETISSPHTKEGMELNTTLSG